jgi:hypothetical protein
VARRNILQRMLGALNRLVSLGGGAEEAPSPSVEEASPTYEQYAEYEPLPSQPQESPPQYVQEETTITEVTPVVPMGDNTEYIPGHMSGKNLKNPVYGRWRVTDPELGDLSDLIDKVPQGRVTVVVCGELIVYANGGVGHADCKTYPFNTEDIDAMLDSQLDSEGGEIEFVQDLINDLVSRGGDEWGAISEINVLNKEDDPRG